jgi:hypothetical protein
VPPSNLTNSRRRMPDTRASPSRSTAPSVYHRPGWQVPVDGLNCPESRFSSRIYGFWALGMSDLRSIPDSGVQCCGCRRRHDADSYPSAQPQACAKAP